MKAKTSSKRNRSRDRVGETMRRGEEETLRLGGRQGRETGREERADGAESEGQSAESQRVQGGRLGDRETLRQGERETLRLGAGPAAAMPGADSGSPPLQVSESPSLARRRVKRPVPKGAVWWHRGDGHPCLQFFGAELRHQRWVVRGWSLGDLHEASGLCRSFLCDLENGKAAPTEEVILELEAALGMEMGGLMNLVNRRWMQWVRDQGQRTGLSGWLGTQARHIRRAIKRGALAEWLGAWLALPEGFWSLEPMLES